MQAAAPGLLAAYPNAGIPRIEGGQTVYDLAPEGMGAAVAPMTAAGARILGGCCGSTPDHIRRMAEAVRKGVR
jgi:methionine synthase I (cobalamin-dependent)